MSDGNGRSPHPARAPRALPAMRALDELVNAPDAEARVQRMPAVQLNDLVNRLGLADAGPLIALATDEQLRELVDLQVWQTDRIAFDELVDWLHEVRAASPARSLLHAFDIELLGFALRHTTRIYLIAEDEVPEEPEGLLCGSPDGWFALDIGGDPDRAVRLRELVAELYAENADEARALLQNLQWELPDELEEWALRWRNGRLADLGFADPREALESYAYLDPASVRADEGTADRPLRNDPEPVGDAGYALALFSGEPASLWSRAVAQLPAEVRARLAPALLAVANRALAADRVPRADLEQGRESLEQLHWRLALGLEHLSDGELDRAVAALDGVGLMRLARLGHSLVLDLRQRLLDEARRGALGRRPGALDLLDLPLRDELSALAGQRPLFFDAHAGQARPFRTREDLRQAASWIDSARCAPQLVPPALRPSPLPPELTLGDLFRTTVVDDLVGRAGALTAADLARFVGDHARGGKLSPAVLERARALAEHHAGAPLTAAAEQLVADWIGRLEEELGALSAADLDLRFVGGLWLES